MNKRFIKFVSLLCLSSFLPLTACSDKKSEKKEEEQRIVIDNNEKTTFSLNVESLVLDVGEEFKLEPKSYVSRESLTWVSSAKNIVSVDKEGNIEAIEQGSAVISVYDSIAVASITVTVAAPDAKITISLDKEHIRIGIGEDFANTVVATVTSGGEIVSNPQITVTKKEESTSNVASVKKINGMYKFEGVNEGNCVYSFIYRENDLVVGANLYIEVISIL